MAFKPAAKKTITTKSKTNVDQDEFAGLWINVGVVTAAEGDDESEKFNRLPRGIAISDLVEHRIYANSYERNPEWAEEAQIVNALIAKIREKAMELEEGESMPINLSVQLYRRQEQVESVEGPKVNVDLDSLFNV